MKEPKLKTVYVCSNCGETSPRWMGRCPSCGSWNTMNEDVVAEAPKAGLSSSKAAASARQEGVTSLTARRLADISTTEEKSRILTGISELDRVLGGGIVLGGVVLLSGEPGVGKSTMLLQLCGAISNQHSVLYITGEESVRQVKLRAARLKVPQENIYLAAENDVDEICGLIEKEKPELVVIDSIQTMRCMDLSSSAGTVSQVKESAARLLAVAKKQEIPMFIVGHVNKDGAIAGPKVMEHIVDTVLYFEGDKMLPYRILRAAKNRYGSTNELGMFDMTGQGLEEIENPSQMLLEGRPLGVSGNCVACTMEGSRPILSEIQALATKTNFPAPRRACSGYDYNRLNLLIALPAALVTLALLWFAGASGQVVRHEEYQFIRVIPYLAILVMALAGVNVFIVLLAGIVFTGAVGIASVDGYTPIRWCKDIYSGFVGMDEVMVLSMLVGGLGELMRYHGGISWLLERVNGLARKLSAESPVKAGECCISLLV